MFKFFPFSLRSSKTHFQIIRTSAEPCSVRDSQIEFTGLYSRVEIKKKKNTISNAEVFLFFRWLSLVCFSPAEEGFFNSPLIVLRRRLRERHSAASSKFIDQVSVGGRLRAFPNILDVSRETERTLYSPLGHDNVFEWRYKNARWQNKHLSRTQNACVPKNRAVGVACVQRASKHLPAAFRCVNAYACARSDFFLLSPSKDVEKNRDGGTRGIIISTAGPPPPGDTINTARCTNTVRGVYFFSFRPKGVIFIRTY